MRVHLDKFCCSSRFIANHNWYNCKSQLVQCCHCRVLGGNQLREIDDDLGLLPGGVVLHLAVDHHGAAAVRHGGEDLARERDLAACEAQFRNAFLMGCAGAWTLHPNQVDIAKRVFSPDPGEVAFAKKILAAMPDGSGAAMIEGKMQDDATWKQARVIVDLAKQVAAKDPEYAALYQLSFAPH